MFLSQMKAVFDHFRKTRNSELLYLTISVKVSNENNIMSVHSVCEKTSD